MSLKRAFTVGYQGADPDALAAELRRRGVSLVIDTRLHPTSRRPAFRRQALSDRLLRHGIGYLSQPALGMPKRYRPFAIRRRWLFRMAYEGSLRREAAVVNDMVRLARRTTIALLCFEFEPGDCHRLILADTMASRAPLTFTHLRLGRSDHPHDKPALPAVVGPQQQDQVAAR